MLEKRFFVEGLAHASDLIGDSDEAAVTDPKRDVDNYLDALGIFAVLKHTLISGRGPRGHLPTPPQFANRLKVAPRRERRGVGGVGIEAGQYAQC